MEAFEDLSLPFRRIIGCMRRSGTSQLNELKLVGQKLMSRKRWCKLVGKYISILINIFRVFFKV